MKYLVVISLFGFLAGCVAGTPSTFVVKIPPQEVQNENVLVRLKINDLRTPLGMMSKREAAFGLPMGNITFDPPEAYVIQNFLEVELTKILKDNGIQSPQNYVCDLLEFIVNTDTTILYWDVVGRIQFVLKQNGKEYRLSGTHTVRTYVWPSEDIIKKVVYESLKQIASGLRKI